MISQGSRLGRCRASDLLNRLGLNDGQLRPAEHVLERALQAAGLTATELPETDPLLAGAVGVLDRDVETVWLRQGLRRSTRNYLVAHEVGHWCLHPHERTFEESATARQDAERASVSTVTGYSPVQRNEVEASAFAAELLVPQRALVSARRSGMTWREIADHVGVDSGVVARQLVLHFFEESNLTDGPRTRPAAQLDDGQRRAAESTAKCAVVMAGPGTGKTVVLIARVLHLLRTGVPPEAVMVLTFSRSTAEKLRSRLQATRVPEAARVPVYTAHALGLEILRRYGHRIGLPPNPRVVAPAEAIALLEDEMPILSEPDDPYRALAALWHRIASWKADGVQSESISGPQIAVAPSEYAEAYRAYHRALRGIGGVDFADLTSESVRLLDQNPSVRDDFAAGFAHVLVDEVQDLEPVVCRLLRLLHARGVPLYMLADPAKSTYAFRGPDWAGSAREDLLACADTVFHLNCNYRCTSNLARATADFARAAQLNATESAGDPHWTDNGALEFLVAYDEDAQCRAIARAIRRNESLGMPLGAQAVLCRTHAQAAQIARGLARQNVPVHAAESILGHPTVRPLLRLIGNEARSNRPNPVGTPDRGETAPEQLSLLDIVNDAIFGRDCLAETIAGELRARRRVAWLYWFIADAVYDAEERGIRSPKEQARTVLKRLRRAVALREDRILADVGSAPEEAVHVLTIHASKGCEFDAVFLPYLNAGYFPPAAKTPSVEPDDNVAGPSLQDEARLAYVALSRARRALMASRCVFIRGTPVPVSELGEMIAGAFSDNGGTKLEEPAALGSGSRRVEDTAPNPNQTWDWEELELYRQCPRQYLFWKQARCVAGFPSALAAFREVLRSAIAAARRFPDDPDAALEAARRAWQEAWADVGAGVPCEQLYARTAEAIMSVAVQDTAVLKAQPGIVSVSLKNGTVTMKADSVRVLSKGIVEAELYEFRPVPRGNAPPPSSVLMASYAADQTFPARGVRIAVRYLPDNALVDHLPSRQAVMAEARRCERIIAAVARGEFPAKVGPWCSSCLYLFECPRDFDGEE